MASMATMGHCSIYVVLLQTAVEGPGFADVHPSQPPMTTVMATTATTTTCMSCFRYIKSR